MNYLEEAKDWYSAVEAGMANGTTNMFEVKAATKMANLALSIHAAEQGVAQTEAMEQLNELMQQVLDKQQPIQLHTDEAYMVGGGTRFG